LPLIVDRLSINKIIPLQLRINDVRIVELFDSELSNVGLD